MSIPSLSLIWHSTALIIQIPFGQPVGGRIPLHDVLEDLFKYRGHSLITTSRENHFIRLEKEGSRMSVGYSPPGHTVTVGEVDMFLSMAMHDGMDSLLFISPSRLPDDVRKELEKEKVVIWDRTTLTVNLGEQVLQKESGEKPSGDGASGILDLFSKDEDLDPLKELRSYHEEEIGGFKVHDVDIGTRQEPASPDVWEEVRSLGQEIGEEISSDVTDDDQDSGSLPLMDMPMMAPPEPDDQVDSILPIKDLPIAAPPEEVQEKKEVLVDNGKQEPSKVPDEILMNPWAGFDEWKSVGGEAEKEKKKVEEPAKKIKRPPENPWLGSIKVPLKYSRKKALSVANTEEDIELDHRFLPFLLIKARYELESKDTGEILDKEGTYLYNSITSKVTDVPVTLFDEIVSVGERWKGDSSPDDLTDPKKGYNKALSELRKRISESDLAMDRMVRETLMATIYREIKYRFRVDSFKVESSKRLMVPFWIKKDEKGNAEWMVDGYLGRFISQEETAD